MSMTRTDISPGYIGDTLYILMSILMPGEWAYITNGRIKMAEIRTDLNGHLRYTS